MDIFQTAVVPLSYRRVRGSVVTGLTVTVSVLDARTNNTLLTATACVETVTGSGVYTYFWTHGLTQDTECLVTYTIAGQASAYEFILIQGGGPGGGRAA